MGTPTVSCCLTTLGPASRVQAQVELVRPHVQEVVLAVARNGDLGALDACAHLADRRLAFAPGSTSVALERWSQEQCSGDWILRLEDGQVPSAALLTSLPRLIADRYPTEFAVRRRTLFPTPDRYLACAPWHPRFSCRLKRNLPGLWNGSSDRPHALGERRLLDLSVYELGLITLDRERERQDELGLEAAPAAPAASDEVMSRGVTGTGWPGILIDSRTSPVPLPDLELILRVLEGSAPRATDDRRQLAPVEGASREAIDQFDIGRRFSDAAYRALVTFVEPALNLFGEAAKHSPWMSLEELAARDPDWILVIPCGFDIARTRAEMPALATPGERGRPPIRLAYRWWNRETAELVHEGRAFLTETVGPGQSTRVIFKTVTPRAPGAYELHVHLVHEHERWFEADTGIEVRITDVPAMAPARFDEAPDERLMHEPDPILRELVLARRAAAQAQERLEAVRQTRRYRAALALGRVADGVRQLVKRF